MAFSVRPTKFDECIRSSCLFDFSPVQAEELALQLFEILVCQFLWVALLNKSQIADIIVDDVMKGECSRLQRGSCGRCTTLCHFLEELLPCHSIDSKRKVKSYQAA